MNRIKLDKVVICEGKYDRIKLESVLDAEIITLDGFSVFNDEEKRRLIKKLAETRGVIVVTDSDSAGHMLRAHIKNITKSNGVEHVFIPALAGKEKRKTSPSKEGLLGVEGMSVETLRSLFEKYEVLSRAPVEKVTLARFYADGFSGGENSAERRKDLARKLSLPTNMSSRALLSAINLVAGLEEYERIVNKTKC